MRLALGILVIFVIGSLPAVLLHYWSSEKPTADFVIMMATIYGGLAVVGLVGWGLQVAGDRVFKLQEGTTARYFGLVLAIAFLGYVFFG